MDGGHYSVHSNGTLEIKRARAEDEGTYTCVASNLLGKAENQVRLEVKGKTLKPPDVFRCLMFYSRRVAPKADPGGFYGASLCLTCTWRPAEGRREGRFVPYQDSGGGNLCLLEAFWCVLFPLLQ